mgnify:CR=1 FL=1
MTRRIFGGRRPGLPRRAGAAPWSSCASIRPRTGWSRSATSSTRGPDSGRHAAPDALARRGRRARQPRRASPARRAPGRRAVPAGDTVRGRAGSARPRGPPGLARPAAVLPRPGRRLARAQRASTRAGTIPPTCSGPAIPWIPETTRDFAIRVCGTAPRRASAPSTTTSPPPAPFAPWFEHWRGRGAPTIVFGHWAMRGLVRETRVARGSTRAASGAAASPPGSRRRTGWSTCPARAVAYAAFGSRIRPARGRVQLRASSGPPRSRARRRGRSRRPHRPHPGAGWVTPATGTARATRRFGQVDRDQDDAQLGARRPCRTTARSVRARASAGTCARSTAGT